jgi:pyruvate/2-oxoglutarate/acetoin dehydrogenase E1 component
LTTKWIFSPNATIRLTSSNHISSKLHHSQNIEGTLATILCVRIVYQTFADDAAGLLRTYIRYEDKFSVGFGAKVSSTIMEEAFKFLDAHEKYVGSTYTPVGFNHVLGEAIIVFYIC